MMAAQSYNSELCDICTEHQGQFQCEECSQVFCTNCKTLHLRMKSSTNHTLSATVRDRPAVTSGAEHGSGTTVRNAVKCTRCTEHGSDYVYYCENCHRMVCTTCTVKTHKGHDMTDLLSATEEVTHEIQDALDFYMENIKNQKRQSLSVKNQLLSMQSERDTILKLVTERCQFLHLKLDQTKDAIYKEVNERCSTETMKGNSFSCKVEKLEKDITDRQKRLEKLKQERNEINLLNFAEIFRKEQCELGRDLPEKPSITRMKYYQETSDVNYIATTLKNLFGTIEFTTDSRNDVTHSDCKQQ